MRLLLALAVLAAPAGAVMPGKKAKDDARRFGLTAAPAVSEADGPGREAREVEAFNRSHRGRWNLRFGPMGVGPGSETSARLSAKEAADAFLRERGPGLGFRADQLRLALARTNAGAHHLLFEQVVEGVPVEFSSVKVHLEESGALLGYSSSFKKVEGVSPVPSVSESAAAGAVAADLGGPAPDGGRLVYFPPPAGGPIRLAWKFRSSSGGSWVYYVDARDGRVLLRYDDLRHQACVSSGTVRGMVYDIDPARQASALSRPMRHQNVFVLDASTSVKTDSNGFFCSQAAGKIFTQLQGPFISVSNWNGQAAHYDNGGAVWTTFATPLQSAHPYAADTVHVATINAPAGALKVMPVFASLDVGEAVLEDNDLAINDNDQVQILDASGHPVATYIGQRSGLKGAAVTGTQLRVRLKSNASGNRNGYTISVSSYLAWSGSSAQSTPANQTATFTWSGTHTQDATLDEVNLFYQLNLMHDYFRSGPNASNAAPIDRPLPVMARAGPNLANAYYDPVQGNLTFGDFNSSFALDATVVRHEYTHFVVDQIMPIVNFGQHGAISEAIADYFSASSLDLASIGTFTGAEFGHGALRELDCAANPPCQLFPTHWSGGIHEDSRMLSQALWEIRKSLVDPGNLGAVNGKACADGLVFSALFYYPDSFGDMYRAMKAVSARSAAAVPSCGVNNAQNGLIDEKFSNHGLFPQEGDADAYEPNDGVASATDISSAAAISARIYPEADQDYYGFGAGPGRITVTLKLPENPAAPGNYLAYSMTLLDRTFAVVAQGDPLLDINPTLGGNCPESSCMSSRQTVTLNYDNPTGGQFFLLVSAPPGDESSVSRNNSTAFYSLSAAIPTAASAAGIVSAQFDRDIISFTVNVATFTSGQPYSFNHARLRDHALTPLPGSETNVASAWLVEFSSVATLGRITGQVRLRSGFAARFPAVGNVHLEVFGVNPLGHVQSLGFSNALSLTGTGSSVKAFNNLFNPARGEKATVRWETTGAGRTTLKLFTVAGQHLATLLDEDRPAGRGSLDWHGVNGGGQRVASGVYVLHIAAPGLDETVKFVVVK